MIKIKEPLSSLSDLYLIRMRNSNIKIRINKMLKKKAVNWFGKFFKGNKDTMVNYSNINRRTIIRTPRIIEISCNNERVALSECLCNSGIKSEPAM